MMFDRDLTDKASALIELYRRRGLLLATAESCTGGLISGLITSVAGSSDIFDAGFVTYSNDAKTRMIGVPAYMIGKFGAVSSEVARTMAIGALDNSRAHISVAVTGIAGPGGGTRFKPVGLVHCAAAHRDGRMAQDELRLGDIGRDAVRLVTMSHAITMAYRMAAEVP